MITNRGTKVWPHGFDETFCTDHWRCRFYSNNHEQIQKKDIIQILTNAEALGIDVIKTENLYTFNGVRGFSLGQGE
jgi:isocitrate dehydrogenase